MQKITLTSKEMLFMDTVTRQYTLAGSFDFENNTNESFKETYHITKSETQKLANSIRKKLKLPEYVW